MYPQLRLCAGGLTLTCFRCPEMALASLQLGRCRESMRRKLATEPEPHGASVDKRLSVARIRNVVLDLRPGARGCSYSASYAPAMFEAAWTDCWVEQNAELGPLLRVSSSYVALVG